MGRRGRRSAGPGRPRRRRTPVRSVERPPVHDRRRGGQAPARQHRPQRRGEARPFDRRDGERLQGLAGRPKCRLPAELSGLCDAAHARHPGRRRRRQGRPASGDQGQRGRRRVHPLVRGAAAAPLEHRSDRLHGRHRRLVRRRSAGRRRPQVQAADQRASPSMASPPIRPSGAVALTGARIVTMAAADGGIIDDGVIVVCGDRIVAVGRRGEVPNASRSENRRHCRQDDHPGPRRRPRPRPPRRGRTDAAAELVLDRQSGAGRDHDPRPLARAAEIFAASEMQRAGKILGPRISRPASASTARKRTTTMPRSIAR